MRPAQETLPAEGGGVRSEESEETLQPGQEQLPEREGCRPAGPWPGDLLSQVTPITVY